MAEVAPGTSTEVWFMDEARVGQQGSLTRVWAKRGTRPRAVRDRRYTWAYLFGAVCPERGVGAAVVLPHVNVEAMNLHLAEVSRGVAEGAHAVLVLDGAGWHTSPKLRVPEHQLAAAAPLRAGTQPGREPVGVPARQLPEPPRVGQLRRHRGRLLLSLDHADAHARAGSPRSPPAPGHASTSRALGIIQFRTIFGVFSLTSRDL